MVLGRRQLLKLGLATTTGVLVPVGTAVIAARRAPAPPPPSPPVRAFTTPLPIPPVLRPVATDGAVDRYEVRQMPADVEILPGRRTRIWGYEGLFPGPTIEARSGRRVVVRHHNQLPVPTVVHLHGGDTPPDHDGYPLDLILPASAEAGPAGHVHRHGLGAGVATGSREYAYPNSQPAGTLWYHDHRADFTGPQVYRGLAGFYLIRDDVEDGLPLPRGEREIPLMITDRWFHADGSFFYPSRDPSLLGRPGVISAFEEGVLGDTILVNGAPWPLLEVAAARYRFRLLNGSNARAYLLRLDPPPPGGDGFVQIGSELGLLARPRHHDALLLGPAERYDVVIDFARYPVGSRVVLRNTLGTGGTADVMRFDVVRTARDDSRIPEIIDTGPDEPTDLDHLDVASTFVFVVGRGGGPSTINLRMFQPERIDARPRAGSTERWQFLTDGAHPVHVHGVRMRVLSRVDMPPSAQDDGWKDTVFVRGGPVEVAVRFTDYRGKYVLHCHNLEHEDMMMMTNIEVVG